MRGARLGLIAVVALPCCTSPCGFGFNDPEERWQGRGNSEYVPRAIFADVVACTRGGLSDIAGISSGGAVLEMSQAGDPVVAWHVYPPTKGPSVFLKRWHQGEWTEVGGSATGLGVSQQSATIFSGGLDMRAGSNDTVHVVWSSVLRAVGHYSIYYARYHNDAWDYEWTDVSDGLDDVSPHLAIAPDDSPVVAWRTNGAVNPDRAYVATLEPNGWTGFAGSNEFPSGSSWRESVYSLAVAVDPLGRPAIASDRSDSSPGSIIDVVRFESDEWQKAGATSASEPSPSGSVSSPSLVAEPGGGFVVAWREWREAMGLRDGFHVHDIYVKRFDGSAWVELAGSATGGGVSDSPGDSEHPSLALDRDGNPVVAWDDDSSGNFEIYLKRFNGATWEPIADSASNGGISNSRANSRGPSVATSDLSLCVAWSEREPGPPVDEEEEDEVVLPPRQIVLRCAEY